MKSPLFRVVLPLALLACCARAGGTETLPAPVQGEQAITIAGDTAIRYLEALPEGYGADAKKRWPLVIFLHGSGERGSDLKRVAKHGPPKRVADGAKFPFILLSPQCAVGQWWSVDALDRWLDEALRKYPVDPDRVYLTGLSMGGFAAWAWAERSPGRFAAVAPICGGGDPALAARLKDVPVWAFHGAKDPIVPVALTEQMIAAIKAAGGAPKVTIYPEAQHNSWTEAYAGEELFAWLLAQKRAPAAGSGVTRSTSTRVDR